MMLLTLLFLCIGIVHVLIGLEWISMNLSSWLKMVKLITLIQAGLKVKENEIDIDINALLKESF